MQRTADGHQGKTAARKSGKKPATAYRRLQDAVQAGSLTRVQECLLAHGYDRSWAKNTLLPALRFRFDDIFAALIQAGALVEDVAGEAFYEARSSSMAHIIDPIMKNLTPKTDTALLLLRALGNVSAVKALLRAGVSPNCVFEKRFLPSDYAPCPALWHAMITGAYPKEAAALIEAGADVRLRRPLREEWRYWLPKGTHTLPDETLLHIAADRLFPSVSLAKLLIERGADPAISGEFSSLRVAILNGHSELIQLFLLHGAPADNLLEVAFYEGKFCAIQPLVLYGGTPPDSVLHCRYAIFIPPLSVLGTLLQLGAKFNESDLKQWVCYPQSVAKNPRSEALAQRLRPIKLL